MDPLAKSYAYYSPYQFAGNTPIRALDIDGLEILDYRTFYKLNVSRSKFIVTYYADPVTTSPSSGKGQLYRPSYFYKNNIYLQTVDIAGSISPNGSPDKTIVLFDNNQGGNIIAYNPTSIWSQDNSINNVDNTADKIQNFTNNSKPGQLNAIGAAFEFIAKKGHEFQIKESNDAFQDINQTLDAVRTSFTLVNNAFSKTKDQSISSILTTFDKSKDGLFLDLSNYVLDGSLPKANPDYLDYLKEVGDKILDSSGETQGKERKSGRLNGN